MASRKHSGQIRSPLSRRTSCSSVCAPWMEHTSSASRSMRSRLRFWRERRPSGVLERVRKKTRAVIVAMDATNKRPSSRIGSIVHLDYGATAGLASVLMVGARERRHDSSVLVATLCATSSWYRGDDKEQRKERSRTGIGYEAVGGGDPRERARPGRGRDGSSGVRPLLVRHHRWTDDRVELRWRGGRLDARRAGA